MCVMERDGLLHKTLEFELLCFFFNFLFLGLTAAAAAAAAATNAAIAEAMKVKKIKLEAMSNYHASNNQHGADSENGDMNSSVGKFLCSLPVFKFTFSSS